MYSIYCCTVVLEGAIREFPIQMFVKCSVERFCWQCFEKLLKIETSSSYLVGLVWTWLW